MVNKLILLPLTIPKVKILIQRKLKTLRSSIVAPQGLTSFLRRKKQTLCTMRLLQSDIPVASKMMAYIIGYTI